MPLTGAGESRFLAVHASSEKKIRPTSIAAQEDRSEAQGSGEAAASAKKEHPARQARAGGVVVMYHRLCLHGDGAVHLFAAGGGV